MKKLLLSVVCSVLFASNVNAGAITIDFTGFASGNTGSTSLVTPEATFNSFDANFFVGAAGVGSEICALSGTGSCEADFDAVFNFAISNLTLVTSGFHTGDTVEIFAYDAASSLLGSVIQAADGAVDLTAFSSISRIFFDDSSIAGAGFGYDQISFDRATGGSVPEPSVIFLLGMGLFGLSIARRRKV